jgi:hypothetical protein
VIPPEIALAMPERWVPSRDGSENWAYMRETLCLLSGASGARDWVVAWLRAWVEGGQLGGAELGKKYALSWGFACIMLVYEWAIRNGDTELRDLAERAACSILSLMRRASSHGPCSISREDWERIFPGSPYEDNLARWAGPVVVIGGQRTNEGYWQWGSGCEQIYALMFGGPGWHPSVSSSRRISIMEQPRFWAARVVASVVDRIGDAHSLGWGDDPDKLWRCAGTYAPLWIARGEGWVCSWTDRAHHSQIGPTLVLMSDGNRLYGRRPYTQGHALTHRQGLSHVHANGWALHGPSASSPVAVSWGGPENDPSTGDETGTVAFPSAPLTVWSSQTGYLVGGVPTIPTPPPPPVQPPAESRRQVLIAEIRTRLDEMERLP